MSGEMTPRPAALAPIRSATGEIEIGALRRVFGCFPSGVVALAVSTPDGPAGLAASSFCSVSLDPPLVGVCIRNESATWPVLRDSARLGLSVLGADQDLACRRLAGPAADRFRGLSWETGDDGAVFLHGAAGWLDCSLQDVLPGGDHAIALLRVERQAVDPATGPLLFHAGQLRSL